MAEQQELVYYNGINARTGGYLREPLPLVEFVERVVVPFLQSETAKPLLQLAQHPSGESYAIIPNLDIQNLREVGWGLLFPSDVDPSWLVGVQEALKPLLQHRQEKAGERMRIIYGEAGVQAQDTAETFLIRHGQRWGEPFRRRLPYYLLIAAPPDKISFRFQQELSLVQGVGRLPFSNFDDIQRFGQQVIDRERNRHNPGDEAALFYALHSGGLPDGASNWVNELQRQIESNRGIAAINRLGWREGNSASKSSFLEMLIQSTPPTVILSVLDSLAFPDDDPRMPVLQGALAGGDFPFDRDMSQEAFLSSITANDIPNDSNLAGRLLMLLSSFGAGTDSSNDMHQADIEGISHRAGLTSPLAERFLQLGAACVIAPANLIYNRAGNARELSSLRYITAELFPSLIKGEPVGAALQTGRYNQKSVWRELFDLFTERQFTKDDRQIQRMAELFASAMNVLRLVLLGDPYASLAPPVKPEEKGSQTGEIAINESGLAETTSRGDSALSDTAPRVWLAVERPDQYDWQEHLAELEDPNKLVSVDWTGVSQGSSQKHLEASQPGDLVLAYTSGGTFTGIVGLGAVIRSNYKVDGHSAVSIQLLKSFPDGISLDELKSITPQLNKVTDDRISYSPVKTKEWWAIRKTLLERNTDLTEEDLLEVPTPAGFRIDTLEFKKSVVRGVLNPIEATIAVTGDFSPDRNRKLSGLIKWWGVTSGQREEFPLELSLSSLVEPGVVPVYTGTLMAPNDEGTHYATAFLLDPVSGLYIQSADVGVEISAPPERVPVPGSTEDRAPRRLAEIEQQARLDADLPKQTLAILDGHIKNVRVVFDTGDWKEVDRRLDFVESFWGRWQLQREQRVSDLKQLTALRSQAKALKKGTSLQKGLYAQWNNLVEQAHTLQDIKEIERGIEDLTARLEFSGRLEGDEIRINRLVDKNVSAAFKPEISEIGSLILKENDFSLIDSRLDRLEKKLDLLEPVVQEYQTVSEQLGKLSVQAAETFREDIQSQLVRLAGEEFDPQAYTTFGESLKKRAEEMIEHYGGEPLTPPPTPDYGLRILDVAYDSALKSREEGHATLKIESTGRLAIPAGTKLRLACRIGKVPYSFDYQLPSDLSMPPAVHESQVINFTAPATSNTYTITFVASLPDLQVVSDPWPGKVKVTSAKTETADRGKVRDSTPGQGALTVTQVYQSTALYYPLQDRLPPPPPEDVKLALEIEEDHIELHCLKNGKETAQFRSKVDLSTIPVYARDQLAPLDYGKMLFSSIINHAGAAGGFENRHTRIGYDSQRLDDDQIGLSIELRVDAKLFGKYHWEYLTDEQGRPLATYARRPFYQVYGDADFKPLPVDPLRILFVIPDPKDLCSYDGTPASAQQLKECGDDGWGPVPLLEAARKSKRPNLKLELQVIRESLSKVCDQDKLVEYDILGAGGIPGGSLPGAVTWSEVKRLLRKNQYHVLHILAHGVVDRSDANNPKFYVVMENERGCADLVDAETFAGDPQTLTQYGLRLAVLAVCNSANQALQSDAHPALVYRLLQAGVPAVIAMQDNIRVEAAQILTYRFYDDLARSGRVDMAMAAARQDLYTWKKKVYEWGVPMLLLKTRNPQLFEINLERVRNASKRPDLEEYEKSLKDYEALTGSPTPGRQALEEKFRKMVDHARQSGADLPDYHSPFQPPAVITVTAGAGASPSKPLAKSQDRTELSKLARPVVIKATELKDYAFHIYGLRLADSVYDQVAACLNAGKHIIFSGPPGVAKTSLAKAVCEYASGKRVQQDGPKWVGYDTATHFSPGFTLTTATADWTTFDTVGGHFPAPDTSLHFRPGIFLEAVRECRWLVIDEINRADIDKAFGELFTLLSGQQVDLPYQVEGKQVRLVPAKQNQAGTPSSDATDWIPAGMSSSGLDYVLHPNWRIIGTMNVYDKSSLFQMSFAFMRRFAFIDLELPVNTEYLELIKTWVTDSLPAEAQGGPAEKSRNDLIDLCKQILWVDDTRPDDNLLMKHRAIGPGIIRDILSYVGDRARQAYSIDLIKQADAVARGETASDPLTAYLAEGFSLFIVAQLDGLDPQVIKIIHDKQVADWFCKQADECSHIQKRIRLLYPHLQW